MSFRPATMHGRKARISIQGPSGGGKTTTALRLARGLSPNGKIAVIDAEHGRAELEANRIEGGFAINVLERTRGEDFVRAMHEAARDDFDVVILDSISAEWEALLEEKDRLPEKQKFTGWATLTPKHNDFLDAIRRYPGHVIVTMRSKVKYEVQQVEERGRTVNKPVKLGMEPVARGGTEYEFDLAFEVDHESNCWLNKRPRGAFGISHTAHWREPGEDLGAQIAAALGAEPTAPASESAPPPAPTLEPEPSTAPLAQNDDEPVSVTDEALARGYADTWHRLVGVLGKDMATKVWAELELPGGDAPAARKGVKWPTVRLLGEALPKWVKLGCVVKVYRRRGADRVPTLPLLPEVVRTTRGLADLEAELADAPLGELAPDEVRVIAKEVKTAAKSSQTTVRFPYGAPVTAADVVRTWIDTNHFGGRLISGPASEPDGTVVFTVHVNKD